MQIVRVKAQDIKGLKFIELLPRKTVTVIGGRNRQGKSSLLDAIAMAIGGKKLCPTTPIRKGQAKAYCEVELDGDQSRLFPACTVRRDFWLRENGQLDSKLEITTKEGYKAPSPQTLLNDIVGCLGFDPESFLRMEPREQAEILRNLVGLDFSEQDKQYKQLYDERTRVNDAAKRLRMQAESVKRHDGVPEAEVSVAELLDELKRRQAQNRSNAAARAKLAKAKDGLVEKHVEVHQIEDRIDYMLKQIAELQACIAADRKQIGIKQMEYEQERVKLAAEEKAVAQLEDADLNGVEESIRRAEDVNRMVRTNARRAEIEAAWTEEKAKASALTERLAAIEAEKDRLRMEAKWPVQGLGYDENGVTYQGLPFCQIAASEQREVAVAIAINLNPSLRFFFLKDGSLLDDQAKVHFAELAASTGCQCFMEVVGDGNECSIVIANGEVVRADEGILVHGGELNVGSVEEQV